MKEKIAKWYKQGLWTVKMVQNAVTKGKLTEEEAADILADNTETKEAIRNLYPEEV